jgi:asparagine N-glycosylation enzyme membrane subunit Stt3
MRPHLRLLGVLQVTWGGIGLLLGAALLLLAVGALAIGLMGTGDGVAAGVTAFTFAVFAAALLIGGAANSWAGRALRRHEPAGRSAVLWLSVPNLFVLPFGTALGVYALWVLLHNEARSLFVRPRLDAAG